MWSFTPSSQLSAAAAVFVSICVPSTMATDPASLYTGKVIDYYTMPTGDAPGSCDPYLTDMNSYLAEAFSMSGAAYETLQKLIAQEGTLSDNRLMDNIWQIDLFDYTRGLVGSEELPTDKVLALYFIEAIYKGFTPVELAALDPKPRLYCDSTFLVWTDTAYDLAGVKVPDVPLSDVLTLTSGNTAKSAYWYPDVKEYADINKGGTGTRCAQTGIAGFNLPDLNTMVLCPELLKGNLGAKSLLGYANGKQTINVGSRPTTGAITPGDQMDGFFAVSATWVHEMTHLLGKLTGKDIIDEPGYDADGKLLPQTRDANGNLLAAGLSYKFDGVVNLAWGSPANAQTNADSYAYYAIGCYLETVDWAMGWAMPLMTTMPPKPAVAPAEL